MISTITASAEEKMSAPSWVPDPYEFSLMTEERQIEVYEEYVAPTTGGDFECACNIISFAEECELPPGDQFIEERLAHESDEVREIYKDLLKGDQEVDYPDEDDDFID